MNLLRHVIIDPNDNIVVNIVEYDQVIQGAMPGFDYLIAIRSDIAQIGWVWDGNSFANPNPAIVRQPGD